jgi:hypothetical protein
MGIHIFLLKESSADHPDWDSLRQINDRNFAGLIDYEQVDINPDDEEEFRPGDLDKLVDRVNRTDWCNKERYLHLIDLLEKNDEYWLYFSR